MYFLVCRVEINKGLNTFQGGFSCGFNTAFVLQEILLTDRSAPVFTALSVLFVCMGKESEGERNSESKSKIEREKAKSKAKQTYY